MEACADAVNKGENCIGCVGDCDLSTAGVAVAAGVDATAFDFVAALAAAVAGEVVVVVAQQTQLLFLLLMLIRVVVGAAVAEHDDRRTDLLPLPVVGVRGKSLLIVGVVVREHVVLNCIVPRIAFDVVLFDVVLCCTSAILAH